MELTCHTYGTISKLEIQFNPDGWGPRTGEKFLAFDSVPYAHFDKKDKCYRPADFTPQQPYNQRTPYQRNRRGDDFALGNSEFAYKHDMIEDSSFQLVDTSKTQTRRFGRE